MDKKSKIKAFTRFLKKKNAYGRFRKHFNSFYSFDVGVSNIKFHSIQDFLFEMRMDTWIGCAFNWSSTTEGNEFWYNLNNEWNIRAYPIERKISSVIK